MKRLYAASCALWLAACEPAPVESAQPSQAAADAPTPPSLPASEAALAEPAKTSDRAFGGATSSVPGEPIEVAGVLADPEPYLGKPIKCRGVVSRVCERAGCWLELRPENGQAGLRVPMAGHAFFIPQDAVGHAATIEGQLNARPLSPAERAHLEGEGLKAIGPLALAATRVVIH